MTPADAALLMEHLHALRRDGYLMVSEYLDDGSVLYLPSKENARLIVMSKGVWDRLMVRLDGHMDPR